MSKSFSTNKMASVQLHIGSDEEVLPIESSSIKRTYNFFRSIHEEHLENPWWLCTDISATISKRTLMKWSAHLLLVSIWLFSCLLGLAVAGSLLVGMFYLIDGYCWSCCYITLDFGDICNF